MKTCSFTRVGEWSVCRECGRTVHAVGRVIAECRRESPRNPVESGCLYLAGVQEVIPGDSIGCGCSSVRLNECTLLDELVTVDKVRRSRVKRLAKWNRETSERFLGHSCEDCASFSSAQMSPGPGRSAKQIQQVGPSGGLTAISTTDMVKAVFPQSTQRTGIFRNETAADDDNKIDTANQDLTDIILSS